MNILKDKGIFAFICSNKFAKAKYGEKLRKLILENQLKIYNDLTGINVFKEASVDTCVIQIKKDFVEDNEVYVDNKYYMKQERLNSKSFIFNTPEVLNLRDKIFKQGTMIKDLNIQINRGVLTGFNEAFIIDEDTKNRLIKEDSKNKEIIKPLLRGRDINKWKITYKNLYLIFTRRGIKINNYPSIKKYLSQWKEELTPKQKNSNKRGKGRKPGPYKWYEIQDNVAYYALFEKEKLIYPNISSGLYPVYDNSKYYTNQKCFILTSDEIDIKYLNGLMASNVLNFMFSLIGSNLGSKGYDLNKVLVEQLPIKIDFNYYEDIIRIIDEINQFSNEIQKNENIIYKYLKKKLHINKFSKKLENFYKLTNKQFINEIRKFNREFNEEKILFKFQLVNENIKILSNKLKIKNKELNQIVYKIYKLNEEEINILEKNLILSKIY